MCFTILTRIGFGMGFFGIPHPESRFRGLGIRVLLFWARSKNPENPEIPGIGIGILKPLKRPECKIPKIPKSRGSGSRKRSKIPSEKSRKSQNRDIPEIFSRDGIFRQKATSDINPHAVGMNSWISFSFLESILQPTSYEMSTLASA